MNNEITDFLNEENYDIRFPALCDCYFIVRQDNEGYIDFFKDVYSLAPSVIELDFTDDINNSFIIHGHLGKAKVRMLYNLVKFNTEDEDIDDEYFIVKFDSIKRKFFPINPKAFNPLREIKNFFLETI